MNLLTALSLATALFVLPMLSSAGTADNPVPAPTPSPMVIIIGEPS